MKAGDGFTPTVPFQPFEGRKVGRKLTNVSSRELKDRQADC